MTPERLLKYFTKNNDTHTMSTTFQTKAHRERRTMQDLVALFVPPPSQQIDPPSNQEFDPPQYSAETYDDYIPRFYIQRKGTHSFQDVPTAVTPHFSTSSL